MLDTRTPLRYAIVRVSLTTALGYLCAILLPRTLGLDMRWSMGGLTGSAGVAGWVEFTLLRRTLNRRIGATGIPARLVAKLWSSAALAAAAAWAVRFAIGMRHPLTNGAAILAAFGLTYFAAAYLFRVEECAGAVRRILRLR